MTLTYVAEGLKEFNFWKYFYFAYLQITCYRDIQYCAKEMRTKFAEISETMRISAIKFQTFVSDENAAKFRKQCDESKRDFTA